MGIKYQIVKGFRDILPPETSLFWLAEKRAREVFNCFGYEEIMLPVVEYSELFSRSIGDTTDIVEKEMFLIPTKPSRKLAELSARKQLGLPIEPEKTARQELAELAAKKSLALRPEATASAVRAYVENLSSRGPQKLFYFGPMFRYERPQKGRYRQFWQIGAEAIGYSGPAVDAELLLLLHQYFSGFGLSGIELKLNSLGCKQCRPAYREALIKYLHTNHEMLCDDCKRRLEKNPLRILDCKNPPCIEIAGKAPSPVDFLCTECASHFDKLRKQLDALKLPFQLDPHLVRGLDYYTRTVFEFQASSGLGSQNAVAAGGRYDDLVEELGGSPTPAIGFALGVERLVILLQETKAAEASLSRPDIHLVFAGGQAYDFAFKFLFALRQQGIYADMAIDDPSRSLRSQLKLADKSKSRLAMVIGEDELKTKTMNIKILESGKDLKLEFESLKEMANIDWEEMRTHLNSAGFAFVSRDYEKALIENQNLLTIMKIYFAALQNQEG